MGKLFVVGLGPGGVDSCPMVCVKRLTAASWLWTKL